MGDLSLDLLDTAQWQKAKGEGGEGRRSARSNTVLRIGKHCVSVDLAYTQH